MNVNIVRIGNSRGIRIPKKILEQCDIDGQVDLTLEGNTIVLKPVRPIAREGWGACAEKMRHAGDDKMLLPDVFPDDLDLDW